MTRFWVLMWDKKYCSYFSKIEITLYIYFYQKIKQIINLTNILCEAQYGPLSEFSPYVSDMLFTISELP